MSHTGLREISTRNYVKAGFRSTGWAAGGKAIIEAQSRGIYHTANASFLSVGQFIFSEENAKDGGFDGGV